MLQWDFLFSSQTCKFILVHCLELIGFSMTDKRQNSQNCQSEGLSGRYNESLISCYRGNRETRWNSTDFFKAPLVILEVWLQKSYSTRPVYKIKIKMWLDHWIYSSLANVMLPGELSDQPEEFNKLDALGKYVKKFSTFHLHKSA